MADWWSPAISATSGLAGVCHRWLADEIQRSTPAALRLSSERRRHKAGYRTAAPPSPETESVSRPAREGSADAGPGGTGEALRRVIGDARNVDEQTAGWKNGDSELCRARVEVGDRHQPWRVSSMPGPRACLNRAVHLPTQCRLLAGELERAAQDVVTDPEASSYTKGFQQRRDPGHVPSVLRSNQQANRAGAPESQRRGHPSSL